VASRYRHSQACDLRCDPEWRYQQWRVQHEQQRFFPGRKVSVQLCECALYLSRNIVFDFQHKLFQYKLKLVLDFNDRKYPGPYSGFDPGTYSARYYACCRDSACYYSSGYYPACDLDSARYYSTGCYYSPAHSGFDASANHFKHFVLVFQHAGCYWSHFFSSFARLSSFTSSSQRRVPGLPCCLRDWFLLRNSGSCLLR